MISISLEGLLVSKCLCRWQTLEADYNSKIKRLPIVHCGNSVLAGGRRRMGRKWNRLSREISRAHIWTLLCCLYPLSSGGKMAAVFPWQDGKRVHCKYLSVVPYKALEKFSKALYGTTGSIYSASVFRPVMYSYDRVGRAGKVLVFFYSVKGIWLIF